MQGFVVGFKGAQVFCLHYNSMQAIEVPQSASMQGYLAAEEWNSAYKVSTLSAVDMTKCVSPCPTTCRKQLQYSSIPCSSLQAL